MTNIIVEEARLWIGTRFKHQGRVKITSDSSGGCDCLGLIMGLGIKAKNGKLLKSYDITNYRRAILSYDLLNAFNQLLTPIDIKDLSIGNIILIRINGFPQHLAVISAVHPYISIIHSYAQARKVVEQYLPQKWKENIAGAYK